MEYMENRKNVYYLSQTILLNTELDRESFVRVQCCVRGSAFSNYLKCLWKFTVESKYSSHKYQLPNRPCFSPSHLINCNSDSAPFEVESAARH